MFAKRRIWLAYLIVFVSSTCGLVIELVAGRIMAPFIGVSLYTWTSIIGVVLAGVSLGNYLGGIIADRRASRSVLGVIFVAGAIASVGILVMTDVIMSSQIKMVLLPKIVLFTAAIFFLPSLILGMVSPIVIRLALGSLSGSGNVVGSIYAFSTVGSIFGNFVTGFWLISWIGTRTIVWGVAGTLLLMGVIVGGFWRPRASAAAVGGTLLACGIGLWLNISGVLKWVPVEIEANLSTYTAYAVLALPVLLVLAVVLTPRVGVASTMLALAALGFVYLGWNAGGYRAPCEWESNYYCIRISEATIDGHKVRSLVLDHLIHSYVSLDDPKVIGYGYERVYDELTRTYIADHPDALDTLFIGGGGYTFPKYLDASYPQASVDVLEIDPAVTEAAYQRLALPRDTRIRSFNADARTFLIEWQDSKKYDVVYGDAFNDLSVPYHLTTVEFDRIIASRLKDDGMYMVNVIDKYGDGEFMKAFANSMKEVFPYVNLFSQGEAWQGNGANTYVVMASRKPWNTERFAQVVGGPGIALTAMQPTGDFNAYLNSGRKIVLTDDYAPVDQLVARLFVDRGF